MESVVDKLPDSSSTDTVQLNEPKSDRSSIQDETLKSNGIAESDNTNTMEIDSVDITEKCTLKEIEASNAASNVEIKPQLPESSDGSNMEVFDTDGLKHSKDEDVVQGMELPAKSIANDDLQNLNCHLNDVQIEEVVVESVDTQLGDNVKFETEVVVETTDNDDNEISIAECESDVHESSNNILSEINQSIELNEVLCSSDITQNIENNNCTVRQEVFNKEELLDILEGNDEQSNDPENRSHSKCLETKIALQQLSRLKVKHRLNKDMKKKQSVTKKKGVEERKKRSGNKEKKVSNREENKKVIMKDEEKRIETNKEEQKKENKVISKDEEKRKENKEEQKKEIKEEKSIVNALVQDWEDDEIVEEESISENIPSIPQEVTDKNVDDSAIESDKRNSVDLSHNDGQTSINKSGDDNLRQRRLGRVIKKKVIFDPDNPDTFTKRKSQNKNIDPQIDQEQPPLKKGKTEQNSPRAKSKSPVSKLQWKKPSSKNIKQNKRLTEVDKLLMDEGAVNMIYQLTPEAPKGKKNMKTKAEFIKKLQSSTPESTEMKFRERKKESSKSEDGEPKKLSGKQRSSLSSSVKSPSACDDFENHSADDSIIYRRHSSSSYSSSCMSPRRLSDVDTSNLSINTTQANEVKPQIKAQNVSESGDFQTGDSAPTEIINKSDCLTIKRKLNSKLSLALTKRKRDISKTENTPKKELKLDGQDEVNNFKFLTLKFDQRVAEICIKSIGPKYSEDLLKEISLALSYVDMRTDISVTLLISDSGTLCSDLDLKPLLSDDVEKRTKLANEITKTVRSLLWSVEQHSKLLCTGVWGECSGLALALVALSDVAVASEGASFALTRPAAYVVPLVPGLSSIITSCRRLQQSVVDDLMIFNRKLSSFEALKGGLVTRTLISAGFQGQLQNVVNDIANQSVQSLLLKKKLLNLRKVSDDTFLAHLDEERALMIQFWTSPEGQEMIRGSVQDP